MRATTAGAEGSIAGMAAKLVGAGGVAFTLIDWIITAVVLAAVPLFICGLMLAFWFPAVPFINWLAAIGIFGILTQTGGSLRRVPALLKYYAVSIN